MAKKPEPPPAAPACARVARCLRPARVAFAEGVVAYRGGALETDPRRIAVLASMPATFDLVETDDPAALAADADATVARARELLAALGYEVRPAGQPCPRCRR